MIIEPNVARAYNDLLKQAVEHDTKTSRNIGALLLNSYNDNLPDTGFSAGGFRHLDSISRRAVLDYLEWLGSAPGLYPPTEDMEALKEKWAERGWSKFA